MSKPEIERDHSDFVDAVSRELFDKFKVNSSEAERTKNFLAGDFMPVGNPIDKARFDESLAADSYEGFREIISTVSRNDLLLVHRMNELRCLAVKDSAISGSDHTLATNQLKQLVGVDEDKNYSGICVINTKDDRREIGSDPTSTKFAMHSIGKVFTGVLLSEMIASGLIPPEELDRKGLQLDEDVKAKLKPNVRNSVDNVTLRQTMTHFAGFGDYLPAYMNGLDSAVRHGAAIPTLSKPQDFLQYADDKVMDTEGGTKFSYSNLGMLLAGLSAQHYFNRGKPEAKQYNDILQELVIGPAKMNGFSVTPPANPDGTLISLKSRIQRHMCGSPAGGYWASADDMQKFANHLCDRMGDAEFRDAVLKYGKEFYNEEEKTIKHAGEVYQSSAWFSVHVPSRTSCIMAQNGDHAGVVGHQVAMVIASEQREIAKTKAELPPASQEIFVERLGLQKSAEEKSFVERMRSDPTKGKSPSGFNEL